MQQTPDPQPPVQPNQQSNLQTQPAPVAVLPYATPLAAAPPTMIWREGSMLIVPRDVSLPDLCIKCNAPADGWRLRKKLAWHPSWVVVLFLVNVLLYIVVALVMQKKVVVEMGLCPRHRARRRMILAVGWLGALVGFAGIFGGMVWSADARYGDDRPLYLALTGAVVLVADLIFALLWGRVIYPTRVDNVYGWLKGCGAEFLSNFPAVHRP